MYAAACTNVGLFRVNLLGVRNGRNLVKIMRNMIYLHESTNAMLHVLSCVGRIIKVSHVLRCYSTC